ncbi:MAG: PAS domain S-box protein [Bryobacterales bacterium]|nr:PAS domain S-box protein [Bryobacterales bacterium]
MERADLERWKAREVARLLALVETERRYYQEIVAKAPIGILVLARDLSVLSANRAFCETFGFRSRDVLLKPFAEILPVEGLHAEVENVLASGTAEINRFFELPAETGARVLRISIQRIRSWGDEGEEEAVVSVEDFSGVEGYAKPAELPPPPPDQREQAPVAIWEADALPLRFTYVNRMAEQLLGYPAAEWTGDANFWTRRIHPEDRDWLDSFYRRAAGSGDSHRCEYRAVRADGGTVWLRDIVHVMRGQDGGAQKFSGVSFDVTERRTVEEQVLEAQKFDSTSRVIGRAAHGFNNLLMIIGGYGDQLLSGLGPEDPLRADIEEILRATARVSDVSAQLQRFTRRPASQPKEISIGEFLAGGEAAIRAALPANVTLAMETQSDLKMRADPAQLEQILLSFVSQSVRGLRDGGRLSIHAEAVELGEDYAASRSTLRPGTHAAIVIGDDGAGLDAESRRRLFEPAFGQPEVSGGAMPVAAAYGLLRQNGGDVTVRSSPGAGCEFRLLFPVVGRVERTPPPAPATEEAPAGKDQQVQAESAAEPEPPPAPSEPEAAEIAGQQTVETAPKETTPALLAPVEPRAELPAPAAAVAAVEEPVAEPPTEVEAIREASPRQQMREGAQTVLVVEDEAGIRMLMKKILDRQGYNVIEATGGGEALEIVESRKLSVQLLVTDLVMPHMGGRELAEKLTGVQPGLKVLYVSGFTDDEAIRSGALGPGATFLQKPFTLGSLVEKVREVLGEQ